MTTHDSPDEDRYGAHEDGTDPGFERAQRELLAAYDVDARSRFVDLEAPGVRTQVLEAGTPGDGPPLVFVHGTAQFGAFFAPLMGEFDGSRMVAFDRPGYGSSDPFEYTTANVRATVVDSIAGVLDALDLGRIDLVGHSMGAYSSILFAIAHPERVRHLFLVGSIPTLPGTAPPVQIRLLTVPLLSRLLRRLQTPDEEGVLDVAEVFGEREAMRAHPEFVRAIAAHERDPKAARAGFTEFNAVIRPRGWRPSVRLREDDLRAIRCPTTMVWGTRDPLGLPADVRDAVASIPECRFVTVEAGHIPFLAHPERCAAIVTEARSEHVDDTA